MRFQYATAAYVFTGLAVDSTAAKPMLEWRAYLGSSGVGIRQYERRVDIGCTENANIEARPL